MKFEEITEQLNNIAKALRAVRIQVMLLALKDCKQKHPRVVILENQLSFQLGQFNKNVHQIDEILEELECIVHIKPEHHAVAQSFNTNMEQKQTGH